MGILTKKLLNLYEEEIIVKEAQVIEKIKSNPKHIFAYARKNLKTRSTIGSFEINEEKVNSSSSFSKPDPKYKIENPASFISIDEENTGSTLCDIEFTMKSFTDAIKLVKNNAAPSTDRFPAILLKECADELSKPLYILWRQSQ